MFPKVIAVGRSTVGTLAGSIGEIKESYNGYVYYENNLVFTINDPADVLQGEYWNGSSWIEASSSELSLLPYVVGLNVRYRIKNSFFDYTSSYITGTAGSVEDTGGYSAKSTALQCLGTIIDAGFTADVYGDATAYMTIPLDMVGEKIRVRVYANGTLFNGMSTVDFDVYADVVSASPTLNVTVPINLPVLGVYNGTISYQYFAVYSYPDSGPVAQGQITSGTYSV